MLTDHLKSIPLMKFKIPECNFSRENATLFSNHAYNELKSVSQIFPFFPGELLISEIPYSSILLPEYYNTHCQSCYHRVLAPIPCWCCARVSSND